METIRNLVNKSTQELSSPKMPSKRWPHLQKKADTLRSQHGSIKAFMVANNPSVQQAVAQDEDRAIIGTAPMLCTIDAAYGEGSAAQWLIPQLHDLCVAVGVKTKLDDNQLKQLAQMIRDEFGFLKTTEVMLFVWRFKGGHYGEFYGSVDIQRIMRALRGKFSNERAAVIERHEGEQRDRERQEWAKTALRPEQVEQLRKRIQQEGKI
jgi:hypothetical protein